MDTELMKMCKRVRDIAEEAGEFIRSQSPGMSDIPVEEKGVRDFVTYVDVTSEKLISGELLKLLPGAGVIGEETRAVRAKKQYRWIIDPLDGTTNFLHGLPPYSISIALMDKQEPVLAVVYDIPSADFFYTWEGAYSYYNGTRIRVSDTGKIKDGLFATGFPYSSFDRFEEYMKALSFLMKTSQGVRRLGSAAIDLAYVACGRFDGFWEYNLNVWDVMAGALIVKNAGGKVSDFRGTDNFYDGKEIIATNALIYKEFLDKVGALMVT